MKTWLSMFLHFLGTKIFRAQDAWKLSEVIFQQRQFLYRRWKNKEDLRTNGVFLNEMSNFFFLRWNSMELRILRIKAQGLDSLENSAFRAQFHKPALPVGIFWVLLLKGLIAIISSIDSRWPQKLTWLFAFVLLPTTSFLFLPTRCRLHVVLQCTASHPMQLVQHAILYSLTRSATLLFSPLSSRPV